MRCQEAQELITGLVDGELSHQERISIDGHLQDCPRCSFIYREEQALKKRVSITAASIKAPSQLREKIVSEGLQAPKAAESARFWDMVVGFKRTGFGPAFAVALLVLLAVPVLYMVWPTGQSISMATLEHHQEILDGRVSFVRVTGREEIARELSRSVGGEFAPMGYDLSAMDLRVVGGVVREVRGRKVLVTIYQGAAPSLTCYTFLGTEKDAPRSASLIYDPDKKINFYTFSSRHGVNGVFHREGKLICIFVSKMPMKDLLAIARSKAQPA